MNSPLWSSTRAPARYIPLGSRQPGKATTVTTWTSPVGRADMIDLRRLLELAGTSIVGGAAIVDGVALLKHTLPLEDLSVREEFERPMALLVTRADALEHELTRVDQY